MELNDEHEITDIGLIPRDWEVKFLGEMGKFKNGINKPKEEFGFGFPFVNLMDVFGKSFIEGNESFELLNTNDSERDIYDLIEGDVIFIRSSVKPSGVGLTAVINKNLPNTVYSGFLIRYREKKFLNNSFKQHCFYEENFRRRLISNSTVSANTNINQDALKKLLIIVPPLPEQTAIAEVLSDTDNLIQSLEKQIAKKRLIKQGAMQKLLSPKEGWEETRLGDVLKVRHGKSQHHVVDSTGKYPILGTGGILGYANKCLYNRESVLIGRKGTIDRPQFMDTPFWTVDTLFYTEISETAVPKFLFYKFQLIDWYSYNEASGVPSLNAKTIENIEITIPSKEEQLLISNIISEMDTEIESRVKKVLKYKALKKGLMQNLLTGKIRITKL